jgi:hypothetical protein
MRPTLGFVAFRETYKLPGRRSWRPMPTEEDIQSAWDSYGKSTRDGWEQVAQAVLEAAKGR